MNQALNRPQRVKSAVGLRMFCANRALAEVTAGPSARQTAAPGWQTWRMDGHPEALVDLDAIQANVAALRSHTGSAQVMAIVKSDGYGHGMLASARAALAGGATWLGVVQLADAIELRRAGLTVPVLSLHGSHDA